MASILEAAAPKSDQLNACDFLVEAKTYTIRDVVVKKDGEQRVSVFFEGCKLPWKPCKSMLRVMMVVWNSFEGKDFIGNKLTLFNDETVMWAGVAVGGIRISHMSGLSSDRTISLRATKKTTFNYTVKPLMDVVIVEDAQEIPAQTVGYLEPEAAAKITDDPDSFRDTAAALYSKARRAGQRNDAAVLSVVAKEWYQLCYCTMSKQEDFAVPLDIAQSMHDLLGLKKPLSIQKGAIDYGGDDIVFLDEIVNVKKLVAEKE